jgi:hypothetical protein
MSLFAIVDYTAERQCVIQTVIIAKRLVANVQITLHLDQTISFEVI